MLNLFMWISDLFWIKLCGREFVFIPKFPANEARESKLLLLLLLFENKLSSLLILLLDLKLFLIFEEIFEIFGKFEIVWFNFEPILLRVSFDFVFILSVIW